MKRESRKRLYHTAQGLICGLFVLNLIAINYVDNLFVGHRPLKPGGTFSIEYSSHGTSTFITSGDHRLFILAWTTPFVLLGISGLLYQFNRPDWRRIAKQKTRL